MKQNNIIDLYQDEDFAREVFKSFRFKEGIKCKKCNSHDHYWLKSKNQFQCKSCKFRTTLRSGTILEGSKLPVSYFLIALHLISEKGDNVTPEELQKVTNHKYYDPVWVFLRKIKSNIKKQEYASLITEVSEIIKDVMVLKNFVQTSN